MTESPDPSKNMDTPSRVQEPETSNNLDAVKRSDSEHEIKVRISGEFEAF